MTATDDPCTFAAAPSVAPSSSVPDAIPPSHPTPASPSPAAPDWVNLLPPDGLGQVAVVGPHTGPAQAALAAAAPVVDGARPDTVVLTSDSRRSVTRALDLLGPGGTLRVEPSTRRRRRMVVRRLRRAGFEVSIWWHRPTLARTRCLVRLDRRPAAQTVLRTVADRGRWSRGEAALAGWGLAAVVAGEVSLLARAPGVEPDIDPALAQPATDRPVDGLVTPRFATSRAVIGVSTTPDGHHLARVAKTARHPDDDPLVSDEATQLDALLQRTGTFPGAPSRPSLQVRGSRVVLVEDAVDGLPLDRRAVRRDPTAALTAGRRWVEGLPSGGRSRPADDGRAADLISAPLEAIAARPGPSDLPRAELARRAGLLLAPLATAALPIVFEHGDLSHPNLLRAEDGTLGVVDWERARPDGLPLHDLTLFFAYVVESAEQPNTPAELAEAVGRALRPQGWVWPEIALHCEHLGVDRRALPLLQLASWTRRVAALPPGRTSPHRDEVLWAATIADLEERRR